MGVKIHKSIGITALVMGVLQALFGLALTICWIVFADKFNGSRFVPTWTGIVMFIAAALAIICGITRNHCMLVTILILNIILFLIFAVITILAVLVAALYNVHVDTTKDTRNCRTITNKCYCLGKNDYYDATCEDMNSIKALLDCFAAFNALGSIVCLAVTIIGCIGLCCCKAEEGHAIMVGGGQAVVITNSDQSNVIQQSPYPLPPPYDGGMIQYEPPKV